MACRAVHAPCHGDLEDAWAAYNAGDYQKAYRLFKHVAEVGGGRNSVAAYYLGLMYAKGEGVPENNVQAYAWWSVLICGLLPGPRGQGCLPDDCARVLGFCPQILGQPLDGLFHLGRRLRCRRYTSRPYAPKGPLRPTACPAVASAASSAFLLLLLKDDDAKRELPKKL